MTSCKNNCRQGRIQCVSPWECNTAPLRTDNGGEQIDYDSRGGNYYLDNIEQPARVPGWLVLGAVTSLAVLLVYLVTLP